MNVESIRGFPVTVNDAGFAGFVLEPARELLGPERTHALSHPVTAARISRTCSSEFPARWRISARGAMHVAAALRFVKQGSI